MRGRCPKPTGHALHPPVACLPLPVAFQPSLLKYEKKKFSWRRPFQASFCIITHNVIIGWGHVALLLHICLVAMIRDER